MSAMTALVVLARVDARTRTPARRKRTTSSSSSSRRGEALTQVLHILVSSQGNDTALLTGPHAGAVGLVDDDAVGDARRQKGNAVGERGPSGVVVEGQVRQAVAQCREQ